MKTLVATLSLLFITLFFNSKGVLAVDENLNSPYACPNFEFLKNLQKGDKDEEVFVLQQILNLDKRTVVMSRGPGSKGNETALYGNATREAVKRFQALFIEYIEVADGKFNTKTRTVMNQVCKGPFFTGFGKDVFEVATNTDKVGPIIGIAGPTQAEIDIPFRAYIGSSEAIKTPTLTGLIIDGATAGDVRKTSSTTFSFLITPNEDNKLNITLQFEADSVEDLAGNKNEVASNEWVIALVGADEMATNTDGVDTSILDSILNSLPTATGTDCSTVGSVSIYDYSNPCYGRAPTTDPNQSQDQEKPPKDNSMMQMLQGLMQGLVQALSGMKPTDGKIGGDAACGCTGLPTAQYSAIKGTSGRQVTAGVTGGGGDYVGKQGPPPGICGVRPRSGPKDKCAGIPGPHNSSCCGITSDMTMQPVTGTLAPSPTGMRSGL